MALRSMAALGVLVTIIFGELYRGEVEKLDAGGMCWGGRLARLQRRGGTASSTVVGGLPTSQSHIGDGSGSKNGWSLPRKPIRKSVRCAGFAIMASFSA